jgi:nucleotide-binding universal stress UspA family protein
MPDINNILCPIDFSDASRHALDHAIAMARWYNARIVGLHVFNPVGFPPGVLMAPAYVDEAVTAGATIGQMQEEVVACLEPARAAGVKTTGRVETGAPPGAILDCAASIPADLIVMGTHGVSGFEHLVLGSVTEKVLRKAACPVLTLRR